MAILEVGLGLTLLYLLLSLVCTVVNEWIAQLLSLRARNLEMGIAKLLEDADRSGLAGRLYEHPLLQSVCREGRKPSYLPASIFARALVDVVDPNAKYAPSGAAAVQSFRSAVEAASLPAGLRGSVLALVDQGTTDLTALRECLQSWFDDAMDRASGWYKRRMRTISLGVAFLVAVAFNADTLRIAERLWEDPALRVAVADIASEVAAVCAHHERPSECEALADLPRLEAELRSFPMGWGREADRRIPLVLAGWVLTALALSMGAPFWFDALNKLNIVRSAGRRPERAPPAQG
jgi:hypothetical protein